MGGRQAGNTNEYSKIIPLLMVMHGSSAGTSYAIASLDRRPWAMLNNNSSGRVRKKP